MGKLPTGLVRFGIVVAWLPYTAMSHAMTLPCDGREISLSQLQQLDPPHQKYCVQELAREADAMLNATYQRLMAGLARPEQRQLRHDQRQWLARRDSQCETKGREQGDPGIGSAYETAYQLCMATTSSERAVEFQRAAGRAPGGTARRGRAPF